MARKAFTLVEVLVVIAILTLLMAIFFPTLQRAREEAKTTLCGSNVKQILLALTAYETEYDNFPPALDDLPPHNTLAPAGGYVGNSVYDKMGWWWFHFLTDANGSGSDLSEILHCPSRRIKDMGLTENILWGNYGVNQSVCKNTRKILGQEEFTGRPLSMTNIFRPSDTLLVVDCGYSAIKWLHVTDYPPVVLNPTREDTAYIPGLSINSLKSLFPDQEIDALEGRHPHKVINTGFVDGHVSRMSAKEVHVRQVDGNYHNRMPLWSPKLTY